MTQTHCRRTSFSFFFKLLRLCVCCLFSEHALISYSPLSIYLCCFLLFELLGSFSFFLSYLLCQIISPHLVVVSLLHRQQCPPFFVDPFTLSDPVFFFFLFDSHILITLCAATYVYIYSCVAFFFFLCLQASGRSHIITPHLSVFFFFFTVVLIQSLETRMSTKDSLVIPLEREAVHLNASPEASPRSPSNYLPLIPHLSFFFLLVCLLNSTIPNAV